MTFKLYYHYCTYIHTWACTIAVGRLGLISNVHQVQNTIGFKHSMSSPTQPHHPPEWHVFHLIPAAEVTLSSLADFGKPPFWVSLGQPATPSATPSLCPTPPKMAPSMSPNLPTVTPPTLWSPSNLAPLTGLRWRLCEMEREQTDWEQRSWDITLQMVQVHSSQKLL